MHKERISYLLQQYLDDAITAPEWRELMEYLSQENASGEMQHALEVIIDQSPALADYRETEWEPLLQKILLARKEEETAATPARLIRFARERWGRMVAAAVLVLFMGGGAALLFRAKRSGQTAGQIARKAAVPDDIAPGGNKAVLTLADGSTINLDGAKNGLLVRQGSSQLVKQKEGELAYIQKNGEPAYIRGGHSDPATGKTLSAEVSYNLLATPRGGQYQLVLPDGSKVWLNASSSLRYPVRFTGKERVVELKGEAYFEIAANAAIPFRVSVDHGRGEGPMLVDVLGTHFNIKAYADEPTVNTTLLEGAVKVHKKEQSALIRPGEQAKLNSAGTLSVQPADTEEAIAWKNGLFRFGEATVEDVMRQLSRWYDVEVVYVNGAPKDLFQGEIYRNVNVSKVLKVLEASGVHFKVEGKKIFVQ